MDKENAELTAEDGILYDKEMKKMLVYPKMKTATAYDMPDSVVETDGIYSRNPKREDSAGIPYVPLIKTQGGVRQFQGKDPGKEKRNGCHYGVFCPGEAKFRLYLQDPGASVVR